jgi:signal recognition particle receptor subunit beta
VRVLNVIVTGPQGGGKTAFLKSLSQFTFKAPEAITVGSTGKEAVVEFGRIALEPDCFLYLTALPAEPAFQAVWERLAGGLLGFAVIFDARTRAHMKETKELVAGLKTLTDTPFVVVLNRLTDRQAPEASELKKALGVPREEQIVCCDVNDKAGAKQALVSLLGIGAKQAKKLSA